MAMNKKSYYEFIKEFKNESDRAAVMLGAAKIDTLLYQILDRHLLPSLSSQDELLEGDSPLASFSAKINVCYRLGLISADFAKTLHVIRRIRNAFAHELSGAHLDSGPQADRLNSLLAPWRSLPFFEFSREHLLAEKEPSSASDFKTLLGIIIGRLEWRFNDVSPVSTKPSELITESLRSWKPMADPPSHA